MKKDDMSCRIGVPMELRLTPDAWRERLMLVPEEVRPKIACIIWWDMAKFKYWKSNDWFKEVAYNGCFNPDNEPIDDDIRLWLGIMGYSDEMIATKLDGIGRSIERPQIAGRVRGAYNKTSPSGSCASR